MSFIKKVRCHNLHNNRIYKSPELAKDLDVCGTTIWNYRKKGLPVINPGESPPYFLGKDVKIFLTDLLKSQKRPLRDDEFWCVKCRDRVIPKPNSVKLKALGNYIDANDAFMFQLIAKCPFSGTLIFKNSHKNKLALFLEPHGLKVDELIKSISM